MTAYVALVRAVNVTGTGMLPKEKLKAMGEACGFTNVRTFINSGNLRFTTRLGEKKVQQLLARQLEDHFGKAKGVHVRTAAEMAEAVARNPFAEHNPSYVLASFIDEQPVQAMLDEARNLAGERMALGPRLIYVAYPHGVGQSKLKLPAAEKGTARNMNSVAKIAELLAGMQ